jgi:hypothetical protein
MAEGKPTGKNDFFNTCMTLGLTPYYGELTILDILVRKENQTRQSED